MKTLLSRSGYKLRSSDNVWSRPGYGGIAYNDGDDIEQRIAGIVARATDLSVLSAELRGHCTDWASLYHLNGNRANILRPFHKDFDRAEVLEIGAGCGAITRYLGECGANVLAVEGSLRRAAIARSRTRDLPNVTVVSERFDDLSCEHSFDIITLIGVLEYANLFTQADDPVVAMLERVRGLLKPNGKLIIAIENQLGLKYFAGAAEDHLNIPMYGVEGRYRKDQPVTFGRRSLVDKLSQAGFPSSEFMVPFPDYKLPLSLVTESGLSCADFDSGALAWQSARRDPQLPLYMIFAPELAWQVVAQNGLTLDLANSFLVLAQVSDQPGQTPSILAYHYSTERKEDYCKETLFLSTETGDIEVRYNILAKSARHSVDGDLLSFSVPESAVYVLGKPLSLEFIEIVTRDGWDVREMGLFLQRYLHYVESISTSLGKSIQIISTETDLPGWCFDLIPQNILIAADGTIHFIDKEWALRKVFPAGWLIFRGLLLLTHAITCFGSPKGAFPTTRLEFFLAVFKAAGFDMTREQFDLYAAMEGSVQAEVYGRSSKAFLDWSPEASLPQKKLHHALAEGEDRIARLHQEVVERDGRIAGLNQAIAMRDGQISTFRFKQGKNNSSIDKVYQYINNNTLIRFGYRLNKISYRRWNEYQQLRKETETQPLFDAEWYLARYPDVKSSKILPLRHYFYFGAGEGRDPNPYFDTRWYLNQYPDVADSGMNPLFHYLKHGVMEARNPSPYFDTRWYLGEYPDVASSGLNPLLHYIKFGGAEGKKPNPFFDTIWYLESYPEVAEKGMEPLHHYLVFGLNEAKNPNPHFDTRWYLSEYSEVVRRGMPPLLHYIKHGIEKGTNPNPYFDTRWYLQQYPEVAKSGIHPLVHYLQHGIVGETNPNPYFDTGWYLRNYPEIAYNGLDPLLHYILHGISEKRNPGPHFDTSWYLQRYPDVIQGGMDPLLHFIRHGAKEGRDPNPYFDTRWYLDQNADVITSGMHPFQHYVQVGIKENRQPHPAYDTGIYLSDYCRWLRKFHTLEDEDRNLIAGHILDFCYKPVISVLLPVDNPPPQFFDEAILSVRNQLYPHWQLCIADDASTDPAIVQIIHKHMIVDDRIKIVYRREKGEISRASNSALEMATGEFVALLDHADLLSEDALFWVVETLQRQTDAGVIFSDEDKIDGQGKRTEPYFKCDWNPFLFLGQNMISRLGVYRTALLRETGGFRVGYEGCQDYDLTARIIERLKLHQIVHIPRVLYHWRVVPGRTAAGMAEKPYAQIAREKAINEHLQRMKIPGRVEMNRELGTMQVIIDLPQTPPLVSIIIPTRNGEHLVRQCIESILAKTAYPDYEIILVNNGSYDPAARDCFADLADQGKVRLLREDGPFNYSRLNNRAAREAKGEVLVLLNNDTEVISPGWLSEMVSLALLPQVGTVGAKLLYPDGTIQHGGVVMGVGGCASHIHCRLAGNAPGYFGRAQLLQMYTAVTAACLAVRKIVFDEVGGLDEDGLKVGYNDVEFCLKLRKQGYWNVWTPFAELIHHESITRGYEDTHEKKNRFLNEQSILKKRWSNSFFHDPAYNPNLTFHASDFSLARHPRLALAARCQPQVLPRSLAEPPVGKPNLLLVCKQRNTSHPPRIVDFAESLLRQEIINSYVLADEKGFTCVSPAASGWFDVICLQGDPSGIDWFQQSVMGSLPYLVDWDDWSLRYALERGGISDETCQSLVHAGVISGSSANLLHWFENRVNLDLQEFSRVVPNGVSFSRELPRVGKPEGIIWRLDSLAELPPNLVEILQAVDEFSQKHDLPVYCQGEFTGEILGKITGHQLFEFLAGTDLQKFLQTRGPLLGIAPMKIAQDDAATSALVSDTRMAEFGGLGIAGVYSSSPQYRGSDLRTGRIVNNTSKQWLAALDELYGGGYQQEDLNILQVREKRSIDRIARECWWPLLEKIQLKKQIAGSAMWSLSSPLSGTDNFPMTAEFTGAVGKASPAIHIPATVRSSSRNTQ